MADRTLVFIIIACLVLVYACVCALACVKKAKSTRPQSVAIVSMIRKPKSLQQWLAYHKSIGIDKFYIRLEDTPELHTLLNNDPCVQLEVGSSADIAQNGDKSYDSVYERQRDFIKRAIEWSKRDNMDWLIHIDCDELIQLECKGKVQDAIHTEIQDDSSIYNIVMENYEAQYDRINTSADSCFNYKSLVKCADGGCVSYANGKSMGKITNKLVENGPHRFAYNGHGKVITARSIRLLHFESCDFEQYMQKYLHLASKEDKNYPFDFYNESIKTAKEQCDNVNHECVFALKEIYTKYKIKRE